MDGNFKGESQSSQAFKFTGDGGRYFLICLVNSLLVFITLGIYLPWALMKCRRYIYSNMKLDGQSFTYGVTGGSVFLSWLMLMVIYIVGMVLISYNYIFAGSLILLLLVLSIPVLIVKNLHYQGMMTTLNGIRFSFKCGAMRAWWNMLGLPIAMLLGWSAVIFALVQICPMETAGEMIFSVIVIGLIGLVGLGVASGISYSRLITIVGQGGRFGIHRFDVQINVRHCIKSAILAMMALIPFLVVVGFILSALLLSMAELDTTAMTEDELEMMIFLEYQRQIIISEIIYYIGIAVSMSYLTVAFRNHFLNNLKLADGNIRFRSTLTFHGMVYRLGSLYVISAITGGLAYPLLRMWVIAWLAENTFVVGNLDELELTNSDDVVENGVVARLSRGMMPTLDFM